jgi:hypothetical protein
VPAFNVRAAAFNRNESLIELLPEVAFKVAVLEPGWIPAGRKFERK